MPPSAVPGKISIAGKRKASSSPPLAATALMTRGSCQTASSTAFPPMVNTQAVAVVAKPAAAPAKNEPDLHAIENPDANSRAAAMAVDTWDRVWKSVVGRSTSHAPLVRKAPANNAAMARFSGIRTRLLVPNTGDRRASGREQEECCPDIVLTGRPKRWQRPPD